MKSFLKNCRGVNLLSIIMILACIACGERERSLLVTESPPDKQAGTVIMGSGGISPMPTQNTQVSASTAAAGTATTPAVSQTTTTTTITTAAAEPPKEILTAVEPKTLSTNDKVGVLRCDTFVDRYVTCITKNVPKDKQDPLLHELETWVTRWKGMAVTPQGVTDVGNACLSTFDRTKQAMATYGCTWESL